MRIISVVAIATVLVGAAPAMAQEAGAPGANGAIGPLTGHNTTGSSVSPQWTYRDYGPGGYGDGPTQDYGYDQGPGPVYGPGVGYEDRGYWRGPGMIEGRSAAEDAADPTPYTVRGGQNGQDLDR